MSEGSKLLQYVAAIAANLSIVATGAMLAWSSPMSARLKQDPVAPDNPLGRPINDDEISWIGSLVPLGTLVGSSFAGLLGEKFGRKKTLLFSVVPYLIGWALVATTGSIEQLYAARLLFGIPLSMAFTLVPMYCGEIAQKEIRGILGSFLQLFITVGFLYSYAIGPYVSYTILWIACGCLPIVFFVCFMFMPESPYYLVAKGEKLEATKSLCKLRGKNEMDVQNELDEIQASVDKAYGTETKFSDLFTVKANFKALLLSCAAVSFQQFTGINIVIFYSENIFASTGAGIDAAICTIIIGAVQIAASAVTPNVVDRLGRRVLLITSGIGTTLTTGVLGYFFYLKQRTNYDTSSIGWLPLSSLVIFMVFYCIGWGPLPWAIMGELFSSEVKAKASSITVFLCWGLAFILTRYFSSVEVAFGTDVAFWIFTVLCILSVLYAIFLLPETKGKSLEEIQDILNGVKSNQISI